MTSKNCVIIAEAGINHNGSLTKAKELVDVAKYSGADYVKFQTFKASNLATIKVAKARYQKLNAYDNENMFTMLKSVELSFQEHEELAHYCKLTNIKYLSSPFDIESINFLIRIGIEMFKVPSGEITNTPYLRELAKFDLPTILSTGMSDIGEVNFAIDTLTLAGLSKNNLTLLQCNTDYPTIMSDVNLNAMKTLSDTFNLPAGYSDHTMGITAPIAAAALGASVIEKHFTLDRSMPGPDHSASLEPAELKNMVSAIRDVEACLGDGVKKPSKRELKNIELARKSIVAKQSIQKGEKFTIDNLDTKRNNGGISARYWDDIIGKRSLKNFETNEAIEF